MSDEKKDQEVAESEGPVLSLAEFLETIPPNQQVAIKELTTQGYPNRTVDVIRTPEIQLHCPDDACNGTRFFRCTTQGPSLGDGEWRFFYLTYRCSNCQRTSKVFALGAKKDDAIANSGKCYKFGELPPFGPPTPPRLIKLVGPDRELFLKGRRCENQGLGVGAFVYYRRVVENQKNRILDEILKVASKIGASPDAVAELEAAKKETQFSKALSMVKQGIPQSLLINGHNPLFLLHGALSEGIHDRSDEECLELASSVRVVLIELSDRLGQALKDEAELNHALSVLLGAKNKGAG